MFAVRTEDHRGAAVPGVLRGNEFEDNEEDMLSSARRTIGAAFGCRRDH